MSEEQQAKRARVTRALANPVHFTEAYFAPFDPRWPKDEHGDPEPVPAFGQEILYLAATQERLAIQLAPEFMKTTLVSQALPVWETLRSVLLGEALYGMLLCEEEDMAKNNLSVVAWHLLENPLIAKDFSDAEGRPVVYPDPEEKTWRDDAITVVRPGVSKEPTWQAKGLDSKGIHGRRLSRVRADDLVTPANASSPTKRKNALKLWDEQVTTRLVKGALASVTGNFNDEKDLLSTLGRRARYYFYKRPAHFNREQPDEGVELTDRKGELLWPEVWGYERLQEERDEKPHSFRRIYLLDDRDKSRSPLKEEWATLIQPHDTPWKYAKFYIGIDPAPGSDESDPDFFNITVGALHSDNMQLDVALCLDVRADPDRQTSLVATVHDRFQRSGLGVIAIGLSKVALDRYFSGALTIGQPELDAKLVAISVPGDEQNKSARLEMLGPYASTGFLRFQEEVWHAQTSDHKDRFQEETLSEQWVNFPGVRHDDKLDGLDIMIRTAREFSSVGDTRWVLQLAG